MDIAKMMIFQNLEIGDTFLKAHQFLGIYVKFLGCK